LAKEDGALSLNELVIFIPITLLILNFIVVIHELGHFLVARHYGVRTPEFSVGFGPLLAKFVHKDVQYSLRAVPLGGFVKISGMAIALEGEETDEDKDVPVQERFSFLSLGKKIAVIVAGPMNNLILSFLSLILIAVFLGVPTDVKSDRAIIGAVTPKTPAYEAGLSRGDEIIAIDDQSVDNWGDLVRIIHRSPNQPLDFTIRRQDQTFHRTIKPFLDPNHKIGLIGIEAPLVYEKLPFKQAVVEGLKQSIYSVVALSEAIGRMIVGKERITGIGPVGMVSMVHQAATSDLYRFWFMFAMFNLFLGFFNLLLIPLPLLDGGWVIIMLLERLRKKEFTANQKAIAQMVGMGLMLLLFVLITYGDISSLIKRSMQ
jgi:regulator of sigma E protease